MAFDLEKVEELLNAISLDLMMISPDNLVEVSGVLGKAEPLTEAFAPLESDLPGRVIGVILDSLKAVIRGQIPEAERALGLVGDGISMLQELARSLPVKAPFKGDVAAWAASLGVLVTAQGYMDDELPAAMIVAEPEFSTLPGQDDAPLVEAAQDESAETIPDFPPDESAPEIADFPDGDAADAPVSEAYQELTAPPGLHRVGGLSVDNFKREFVAEVEEIQVLLVAIEQKSEPLAALSELSRNFRAILGGASLLAQESMAALAYNASGLIEYVAEEQVPYSTAVTDILLKACDYLLKELGALELGPRGLSHSGGQEPGYQAALEAFIDDLWMARQGILPMAAPAEAATSGTAQAPKPKKIGEILIEKGLISEGDLGGLIQAQQEARKTTLGDILVAEKYITQADLDEALAEQRRSPGKRLGEILVALGKVDYEHIDEAIKNQEEKRETKLGEFLVKSKIGAPEKVALALREQKQSEGGSVTARSGQIAAQTVKVETLKLDGLIDLVGELVIAQSLITSNEAISCLKEQKISKDLAHVSRITSELQRNAMSLRMVQIHQTFQKMNRLVRDLAHKFEKDVKFETVGSDTEIDRNMVECIYDPLVHLMRNSLDHGLETPAERRAAGKPPQGTVRLKAYHQGGNVVIELSDDGRGLDRERVLNKALSQGLVAPGEVLSEAALHALVFAPGFSTAEKISDVSGRGVGMDVVKQSIEKLRGKVDFTSVPGRGSTMTIRLPLTLAIIDGMIVRVGEHRYILPTISIVESFRPPKEDYFTVKNQGEMIRVRSRLLPLMRLDQLVGARGALSDPDEALVVVIENEGEPRCLLVDEVLGKQEVVIKSLGERLKYVRALAGGTILGDGRVGLILDVAGLFEASGQYGGGPLHYGGASADFSDDWGMEDSGS
ncbi:MAG: chemotaxis protein CheA [Candidatus Adiutrix sp.]|jgi:two-component system chemotaxis sensor kinase CheA|nr:chemotaxis protein CheA [Candidatus Adiutrix sp.]